MPARLNPALSVVATDLVMQVAVGYEASIPLASITSLIDTENETRVGHFELADGDLEFVTQQGVDPEIRDDVILLSAMQAAISALSAVYQVILVSGTNIKTVNNTSLLGSGNISIPAGATGPTGPTGATGAAGPNTVTNSTTTNITGVLYGNGSTVAAASAAERLGSVTKAELNTAVTDGNVVYVGEGNAGSATVLQTARNINGVSFDGSSNITVPAAGSTLTDTVLVAKGGTGLTALGTSLQVLRVNFAGTALEYGTVSGGSGGATINDMAYLALALGGP